MDYDIFVLQHEMAGILSEKRFYHVLGVQTTSFNMGIRFGCDLVKANLAGLLHDCAKPLSDNELLEECMKYQLPISDIEAKSPYLLHSKLGAYYAKVKYNIIDNDILSAITYHTTGKPNMSLLDKIIFTADFIEPSRSDKVIPNLNKIRQVAFEDLDYAVYLILKNTLDYLKTKDVMIDTLTEETYDYYKALIENR